MTDSTAVALCCARVRKRASDVRLALVPGLSDDLRLIGEAFSELERGQRALAGAFLAKHYGYEISLDQYNAIAALDAEPEDSSCPKETKP